MDLDERRRWLFLQNVLPVERRHPGVFRLLLQPVCTSAELFLTGVLGNPLIIEVCLDPSRHRHRVQNQVVLGAGEVDLLASGEDFMPTVLLVPLGERGRHMHLLDDLPPPDPGVVGAERDLPFLRRVRDDAALGAAEVVVEEVLEPHAGHEQEVPSIGPALLDVGAGPVARDLPVVSARRAKGLVELLHQIRQLEMRRRFERVVVPHQGQRHADDRQEPTAGRVVYTGEVLR